MTKKKKSKSKTSPLPNQSPPIPILTGQNQEKGVKPNKLNAQAAYFAKKTPIHHPPACHT